MLAAPTQFLMIENKGIAPTACFSILGMSTTRDSEAEGTIGNFGSGSKQALNLLLREGVAPIIYCGGLRLTFASEPLEIDDGLSAVTKNVVTMRMKGKDKDGKTYAGKKERLGFCVEYGADDWKLTAQAMQEYVSNAIDRTIREDGGLDGNSLVIAISDKPRSKAGTTRVFIPLTPEVIAFYGEIKHRYLHFARPELAPINAPLEKKGYSPLSEGAAVCYKNGVFVRVISHRAQHSLFDYNLCDLELDESRNSSNDTCRSRAGEVLVNHSTHSQKVKALKSLTDGSNLWEHDFSSWNLNVSWKNEADTKEGWRKAYEECFGDAVLCPSDLRIVNQIQGKGHSVVSLDNKPWENFLKDSIKIRSNETVSSGVEKKGLTTMPATEALKGVGGLVWEKLIDLGMTANKAIPPLHCFSGVMSSGADLQGYYCPDEKSVYVSDTIADSNSLALQQILLEEFAHHITEALDETRDLQDFAFRFAAKCFATS